MSSEKIVTGVDLKLRTDPPLMGKSPPPQWGKDRVTDYINVVRENSFATFVKFNPEFSSLIEIDQLYRLAIDCAQNCRDWFACLFILKSHSAFLVAVQLAVGTQIPESYMVMRGAIENALYGFYIFKHPELAEVWLRRDESKDNKDKVREQFKIGIIKALVAQFDNKLGEAVNILYERTIDYGAHPNEKSLSSSLQKTDNKDSIRFDVIYLTGRELPIKLSIKTSTQIGIACLKIFQLILPERFRIIGISDRLSKISKGF